MISIETSADRESEQMSPPQVILIGGCPGAGKTTLGRRLAARLGYASLTIDDLMGAAQAVTTPESHPGLHLMSGTNYVDYFTHSPVEKLIADATLQHEELWPAVERTIRNHATWGVPIVIDGWHLRPAWTAGLDLKGISTHWLVIDPEVLKAREARNEDFVRDSDNPQQMRERFVARSLWYNSFIEAEAESRGEQILRQNGTQTVDQLCDQMEESFRTG